MNTNSKQLNNEILSICFLFIFLLLGCKDDISIEDNININFIRFEFPQGNTTEDKLIKDIHGKYETYVIYKNFIAKDLDRSWMLSSANVSWNTTQLSVVNLPFFTELLKSGILEKFDTEVCKKVLPIYIYLADSIYTVTERTMLPPGHTEPTKYYIRRNYEIIMTGLDYWAFSIPLDKYSDVEFLKSFRLKISNEIIKKLYKNGIITDSELFTKSVDYETPISQDTNSPDYYAKRGFVDLVKKDFSGFRRFSLWTVKHDNEDYFSFIRMLLYLSEAEFNQKYPKSQYPLIHKRREILIDHLKSEKLHIANFATN